MIIGRHLARGRDVVRDLGRRAGAYRDLLAEIATGRERAWAGIHWLLVATLPNSGSTALAQLLATAPPAMLLRPDGEGQWLVPHLSAPAKRWEPEARIGYALVRAVWAARARASGKRPVLVVEKSPPNICRMIPLVQALSAMPVYVVRFSRDPYAVCASWAKRYSPERIARQWKRRIAHDVRTERGFYTALGMLCGERMALMSGLDGLVGLDLGYEDLTENPAAVTARLAGFCPLLKGIDPDSQVRVKDYAPQPLRNMNDEQIARLTGEQLGWIGDGLRPHAAAVAAAGYRLRPADGGAK